MREPLLILRNINIRYAKKIHKLKLPIEVYTRLKGGDLEYKIPFDERGILDQRGNSVKLHFDINPQIIAKSGYNLQWD